MVYLLILLPIAAIIIWLVKKERSRRVQTRKNEEEFLASMRANPQARTSTLEARAEPPLHPVVPATGRTAVQQTGVPGLWPVAQQAVPPVQLTPSRLPVPDITPRELPGALPAALAPALPVAGPLDGRCMVCGEAVDVRATDQSRWGVKIPGPGSERLVWVHFHCLASRLAEAQQTRGALARLVTALEPAEGISASTAQLDEALEQARQVLGR